MNIRNVILGLVCLLIVSTPLSVQAEDKIIKQINGDLASYKKYVDGQATQGIITPAQAGTLLNLKYQKAQYDIARRRLQIKDPAMGKLVDMETDYASKMRELRDKGEISEAEYQDRILGAKYRLINSAQARKTQRDQMTLAQQKMRAQLRANLLNAAKQRRQMTAQPSSQITCTASRLMSEGADPFDTRQIDCTNL